MEFVTAAQIAAAVKDAQAISTQVHVLDDAQVQPDPALRVRGDFEQAEGGGAAGRQAAVRRAIGLGPQGWGQPGQRQQQQTGPWVATEHIPSCKPAPEQGHPLAVTQPGEASSPPGQCTVHTMHGSKERTTCCTATGVLSAAAMGMPARACSRAPGVPAASRGEKFQVVGATIW